MSIFISISYVILGLLVVALQFSFPEMQASADNSILTELMALIRTIARHVTFPIDKFYLLDSLTNGELISYRQLILGVWDLIILRSIPIGLLGVWQLNRREIGTTAHQ